MVRITPKEKELMAAASFAAAIFLSACVTTPKSGGPELRQRIEQGLQVCEDPDRLTSFQRVSLNRVIGRPVCIEQDEEYSRTKVWAAKGRQVFFQTPEEGACQFTLRNVDEESVRDTVIQLARDRGWLGVPIVTVTSCRIMSCNGKKVCGDLADARARFFASSDNDLIDFRWKLQNGKPDILEVSVYSGADAYCTGTGPDACYDLSDPARDSR